MQNVATWDRIGRFVIGALLAAAPFFTGWAVWTNIWALSAAVVVGAVLILTAIVGFCPIYAALGLRTAGRRIPRS